VKATVTVTLLSRLAITAELTYYQLFISYHVTDDSIFLIHL